MKRSSNPGEMMVNNKRVVTGIQAAQRLTERAKEEGIDHTYTRDAVYKCYLKWKRDPNAKGALAPAVETPSGNLYYLDDINTLPIAPTFGRPPKGKSTQEENGVKKG